MSDVFFQNYSSVNVLKFRTLYSIVFSLSDAFYAVVS